MSNPAHRARRETMQPLWRLILHGKSACRDDVREAVALLRERGARIEVRVTWERGDAMRLAAEASADGAALVIAGGGDGSLNEVCAGLMQGSQGRDGRPRLGVLPLGTANDFATGCGIPDTPQSALELISSSRPRPVDLLRVEAGEREYWCVNVATGGFGTRITVETDPGLKKLLGSAAYLITGLSRFSSVQAAHAHLTGPQFDWQGEFLVLALGNGRQAGGGHTLTPDALLDDGLIDLALLPPPADGELATALGAVLTKGRDALLDAAVKTRLAQVRIRSEDDLTLNLDGEPVTARDFRVSVEKHALQMHLPEACALLGDD